jgi:hypothetical protein
MRATLGGLSFPIPEGWSDHSLITLVGPPLEGTGLRRVAPQAELRPTLVIKREQLSGTPCLEAYAGAQAELMKKLAPGAHLEQRGEVSLGEQKAITQEFVIPNTPGGELRQIQFYFIVGRSFFVVAGTAPNDLRFSGARKIFLELLLGSVPSG